MTSRSTRLAAALLTGALLFGAAACSSDEADETPEPDTTEQGSEGDSTTVGTMPDGDESRPFGVNAEALAEAMSKGTSADDYEIDGNSFRLIYNEGDSESVTATIHCSVVNDLKGDNDSITLVYPDSELNCDDV